MKEIKILVKKNLLDLKYNKYLQYYNTLVIVLFTYIIGAFIAFITKQIDYENMVQITIFISVSIGVIITIVSFMQGFREELTNIPKEIEKLASNA